MYRVTDLIFNLYFLTEIPVFSAQSVVLDQLSRLENFLRQPSSKWIPFLNQERVRQQKERDGLCFSSAVPKTQWDHHCLY